MPRVAASPRGSRLQGILLFQLLEEDWGCPLGSSAAPISCPSEDAPSARGGLLPHPPPGGLQAPGSIPLALSWDSRRERWPQDSALSFPAPQPVPEIDQNASQSSLYSQQLVIMIHLIDLYPFRSIRQLKNIHARQGKKEKQQQKEAEGKLLPK